MVATINNAGAGKQKSSKSKWDLRRGGGTTEKFMNDALMPSIHQSCFPEHITEMFCLTHILCFIDKTTRLVKKNKKKQQQQQPSSSILPFRSNHRTSTEKLQRAEDGCEVGFTSILTSNSCPVDGWRLGKGGIWHSSLTQKEQKETLYAAWATHTRLIGPGETRFHADFLRFLQNKQRYLKWPDWKNTPLCVTSLGFLFLRHAR